ncbi:hypothetical protein RND81_01G016400 [Saponaria officinalis]|uniref:Prolamin-like domain-containing protein n=1 Tax=Saponaria officinalis TaxID=3572 RepID=A0AAW1NFE5_SAPOF
MSMINLSSFIFVLLCIASATARPTVDYVSTSSPTPSPGPSSDISHLIQECASKLSISCGDAIFHYVFGAAIGETITKECCSQLIHMGRPCHGFLTVATLERLNDSAEREERILTKNNQVWELCVSDGQIN